MRRVWKILGLTPVGGLLALSAMGACTSFSAADAPGGPDGDVPDGRQTPDSAIPDSGLQEADAPVGCTPLPAAGCSDGGCEARCPTVGAFVGDLIRIESDGTKQMLRSLSDCHLYTCTVSNDGDGDDAGFDCQRPGIGYLGRACSQGGTGDCSPGKLYAVGVSDKDNCNTHPCTYTCVREKD